MDIYKLLNSDRINSGSLANFWEATVLSAGLNSRAIMRSRLQGPPTCPFTATAGTLSRYQYREAPMKHPLFLLLLLVLASAALPHAALADDNELDCVTTEWKAIGANHKVCVSSYTDPKVPAVTCYISQARTGGIKGSMGLAEDPSNFALSCVRTGPVSLPDGLAEKEQVFKESTNIFFKATRVTRLYDKEKGVLVYLAVSRHIIDGSPFNAVSVVPVR